MCTELITIQVSLFLTISDKDIENLNEEMTREKLEMEKVYYMSHGVRFPTVWYVRPAKPQISLHICTV